MLAIGDLQFMLAICVYDLSQVGTSMLRKVRRIMSKELKFYRLALKNWKNFTEVDVAIKDRIFLVGPTIVFYSANNY